MWRRKPLPLPAAVFAVGVFENAVPMRFDILKYSIAYSAHPTHIGSVEGNIRESEVMGNGGILTRHRRIRRNRLVALVVRGERKYNRNEAIDAGSRRHVNLHSRHAHIGGVSNDEKYRASIRRRGPPRIYISLAPIELDRAIGGYPRRNS